MAAFSGDAARRGKPFGMETDGIPRHSLRRPPDGVPWRPFVRRQRRFVAQGSRRPRLPDIMRPSHS
jgi:hypothetical protein